MPDAKRAKHSLIMHINYCEQGQSLADACRKAVDWGFDGVEFRRKRHTVEESEAGYLDELAAAVEKSGLREVIFGSPGADLMSDDATQHAPQIESAKAFYQLARERFDTVICNTFSGALLNPDKNIPYNNYDLQGSGIATDGQWQAATAGFQEIGAFAQSIGMKLGFETHMGYLHDTAEAAKKLLDAIGSPAVGVTLDYANMMLFSQPTPLQEVITLLGEKIFYVHLKNLVLPPSGGYICTPLADGAINNREFLRELKRVGFSGPICIEAPRPGDREWFAQQDLNYLKAVLNDLGYDD